VALGGERIRAIVLSTNFFAVFGITAAAGTLNDLRNASGGVKAASVDYTSAVPKEKRRTTPQIMGNAEGQSWWDNGWRQAHPDIEQHAELAGSRGRSALALES